MPNKTNEERIDILEERINEYIENFKDDAAAQFQNKAMNKPWIAIAIPLVIGFVFGIGLMLVV